MPCGVNKLASEKNKQSPSYLKAYSVILDSNTQNCGSIMQIKSFLLPLLLNTTNATKSYTRKKSV